MAEVNYIPIPVATAKQVAADFDKDVVIIIAFDYECKRTHSTSYGRTAKDKQRAAVAADMCVKLFANTTERIKFEDFRFADQAERAERIESLIGALKQIGCRKPVGYQNKPDCDCLVCATVREKE